ncbi:MAG TPA: DUF4157 domain-containing protein [Longimicrobiaceae bacterium]|jgi:hypothetical protein
MLQAQKPSAPRSAAAERPAAPEPASPASAGALGLALAARPPRAAGAAGDGPPPPRGPVVRRKCAQCAAAEDEELRTGVPQPRCAACGGGQVRRRAEAVGGAGAATGGEPAGIAAVREVVGQGGGRPLDRGTRAFLEAGFGRDLGGVRVHTGAAADRSARAVSALAYTVGREVVFRAGYFAPGSREGRRLLAHEVAHTLQPEPAGAAHAVAAPDDPAEREADLAAERVVAGEAAAPAAPGGRRAAAVHRQDAGAGSPASVPAPPASPAAPAAFVLPVVPETPTFTTGVDALYFRVVPGTAFSEGEKLPQAIAVVLYALAGSRYSRELVAGATAAVLSVPTARAIGSFVGSSRGGEAIPDFRIQYEYMTKVIAYLEANGVVPAVSPAQREMIELSESVEWLLRMLVGDAAFRAEVGVRLPAWYDAPLARAELLNHGTLLRQFAAARKAHLAAPGDAAARAGMVLAARALVAELAGPAMVLETIRADAAVANHPGYRLLWPADGSRIPVVTAGDPVPQPPATLTPGTPAAPSRTPQSPFGAAFLGFVRTQPALLRDALDPAAGAAAREQLLDTFLGWAPQALAFGPVALADRPATANMPPHPARMWMYPPASPPTYDAAISTDYTFIMQLQFPDVFSHFARYSFLWERIKVPDEELKKGADVSRRKGQAPTWGEVASLRYSRTGRYAYEDIVRSIEGWRASFGAPGQEVGLVAINALLLRPLGTTFPFLADFLATPRGEKKIAFPEGEGMYIIRCRANPLHAGQGLIRAPSVAWLPVFVRSAGEMASTRLAAAVSNRDDARRRLDEIRTILAMPGPIPDRDALVAEGEALFKVLESLPESLEQQLDDLRARQAEIAGDTGWEAEAERKRLAKQIESLEKTAGTRADRSRKHDLSSAERLLAVFAGDDGQVMHLALEAVPLEGDAGTHHWYVSDITTPASDDADAYGDSKEDAILKATRAILEGIHGYGRGQLSIEIGGKSFHERIAQSRGALLMDALENLSTALSVAAVAAAPFTGGASLMIMLPVGVVGAVPSAYRILSRVENNTFHLDMEFAMDVVNIVGSLAGLGEMAVPARMLRVGKALMVIGVGSNGLGVLLMGAQVVDQLLGLEDLPPGVRASRIMQIIGNAMLQAGIMVGAALAQKARLREMEASVHASAEQGMKPHEQKAFDSWRERLSEETRAELDADPALAELYRTMDPDVRRALTLCASPCIPTKPRPSAADVARIKSLIDSLGLPPDHPGLREYLHRKRNDITAAVDAIETAKSLKELQKTFDQAIAANAPVGTAAKKAGKWKVTRPDGVVVTEHAVGTHGDLTAELGTGGFFESHHGIQDAWAIDRGIPGYARDDCPAILLRDSHASSPHRRITSRQSQRRSDRAKRTYSEERQNLRDDMAAADVPPKTAEALLASSDAYFGGLYTAWEQSLRASGVPEAKIAAKLAAVFGTWSPPAVAAP